MIRKACPEVLLGIGADRIGNAAILRTRMSERSVFLLDDGFQHRKLHRDIDIVCIHDSLFNDRLLPQGYLREPVSSLKRADVFFLICSEQRLEPMKKVAEQLKDRFPEVKQFLLNQCVAGWVNTRTGTLTASPPFSRPVVLSGIARPHRFLSLLSASGITPVKTLFFPDHHPYTEYDILSLRELYSHGLVTTEKDAIRLQNLSAVPEKGLWYLKMRLKFTENDSLDCFHHYIKSRLTGSIG
jgi:tetraacyldisaccharide 4'-kinase